MRDEVVQTDQGVPWTQVLFRTLGAAVAVTLALFLLSLPTELGQDPPVIQSASLLSKKEIAKIIWQVATRHELDPALLQAVIRVESNFNPMAVSPKGALGLMQLMPDTAASLHVGNPFDPVENIRAGAKQLRYLLNRFQEDLELALAAYHAGEARVSRHQGIPPIKSTEHYVSKVLGYYEGFRASRSETRRDLRVPVQRQPPNPPSNPRRAL